MNKLTSKSKIQKIVIVIIIVMSFNFIAPTYSRAGFGGVLMGPIIDFLSSMGDAVLSALQYFMYDGNITGMNTATGAITGVATIVNPWDSFMLMVDTSAILGNVDIDKVELGLKMYDIYVDNNVEEDITINADKFDKGWVGSIFGIFEKGYGIPIIKYTPEKIFANEVPALDANFINPKKWEIEDSKIEDDNLSTDIKKAIKDAVKNAIENNEQVKLDDVLNIIKDYTNDNEQAEIDDVLKAIQTAIQDTIQDVKQNGQIERMNAHSITQQLHSTIANWYVALRNFAIVALLSVLLYVGIRMIISSTAADKSKYKEMLMQWVVALCILFFLHYIMSFILTVTEMITDGIAESTTEIVVKVTDGDKSFKFRTDLTGLCRLQIQYSDLGARMIYLIFYIALVIYTVMFTWVYVKRAITMAFLTLMAPVVAITYPIDKIGDGKAQAFGIWLKEFMFNALLQPFHLIIFTVFLGAASEIAVMNPVYAILFLAFIIPAEKLLRKMFGFDKASTAGAAIDGAAKMFGGAAAFKMLSKGMGRFGGGKNNKTQSGGKDNIRTKKPVEDKNGPQGYEAFANVGSGNDNNDAQQRMLEAEDENFGTSDWDPQARDQYARNTGNNESMNYSQEEYAVQKMLRNDPRYANNSVAGENTNSNVINTKNSSRNNEELTKGKRVLRGVKAVGRKTFSGQNVKKIAKFAGRTALRAGTTATGLTIGLGMGIAGGDLEDVLTYGAAGAFLGNRVLGDAALNGISKIGNLGRGVADTFSEGYYGVNEAAIRRQTRDFLNDENRRQYYSDNFTDENDQRLSNKELDKIMEKAAGYNNLGISDDSSIKRCIKLEKEVIKGIESMGTLNMEEEDKDQLVRYQSARIAKIADQADDKKLLTSNKYRGELVDQFKNGLKKANPNMDQKDLEKQSSNMLNLLLKYKKMD